MVQVKIPTPLRKYTGGAGGVEADGGTVAPVGRRHHLSEPPGCPGSSVGDVPDGVLHVMGGP